jgi:UDP-hydrolysing UDP-N-acetyl-D-glucosamine 2-epimerase
MKSKGTRRARTDLLPGAFISQRSARNVCFVTGTRAEFGLMKPVLRAVRAHPKLMLQLIITGMHLDRSRGYSVAEIQAEGWLDGIEHAMLPWRSAGADRTKVAAATGAAVSSIARCLDRFRSDIVLVCGDRVEAFAGATAGHLAGRVVAHVHGGDRALGQVDDCLRHAITKLSHIHLAATTESAARIARLGEDRWRTHVVGAPGIDGITRQAIPIGQLHLGVEPRQYALLVLHPADADETLEAQRACIVLDAVERVGFPDVVVVYPNTDPGSQGIVRRWSRAAKSNRLIVRRDLPRGAFLGLLKHAAVLVGNSSAGIIEAASFGTPVLDIGDRQAGRVRSQNVVNVPYRTQPIVRELKRIWNGGVPRRSRGCNVYGGQGAGRRIAAILAAVKIDTHLVRKLIAY